MTLVNSTGKVAAFYYATGENTLTDEAMQEVNLISEGYPAHSVFEVANSSKRYLVETPAPVFQQDQGTSTWITLTPAEVQYAGGRIFLSTPLASGVSVRVHSGKYYTVKQCLGASDWRLDMSWQTEKAMKLGDSVPSTSLIHKDWTATVGAYWALTQAAFTSTGGNANSHITLTHEPGGTPGNNYELVLVDPHTLQADETVSVSGNVITVTLASSSVPAITTTAAQLVDALMACDAVLALGITAKVKDGETGAGIVAAIASPNGKLTGGLDAVDLLAPTAKVVAIFYEDYSNDKRYEGFAVFKSNSISLDPGKLIKQSLTMESCGSPLYYRDS